MSDLSPKDEKNYESESFERHTRSSGDMDSIHGMSNYQITTQEGQSFGFYADTGQGKGGQGGPGTGKHVLNTPGMSMEVLGKGLKVRDEGDTTQLPAKQTICKRGDVFTVCENGDVIIRARNIILEADGAGNKDGQILINANRMVDIKAPDIKEQGEKILQRATQEIDTQTNLKKDKSNFNLSMNDMDKDFGASVKTILNQVNQQLPKAGEKLKAIEEKGKPLIEKQKNIIQQGIGFLQSDEAANLIGGLSDTAQNVGQQVEESGVVDDIKEEAQELQNRFKGIFNDFENQAKNLAGELDTEKLDKIEDKLKKTAEGFGGIL
jgi:hypothetical protein